MPIKYSVFLEGNLKNNRGKLTATLLRQNFQLCSGNWEFRLSTCVASYRERVDKAVAVRANILRSWQKDSGYKLVYAPTVLGVDLFQGQANEKKIHSNFCNRWFSFNQVEQELEVSFVELGGEPNLLVKSDISIFLTVEFKKVED
jgi:hypothetical protein